MNSPPKTGYFFVPLLILTYTETYGHKLDTFYSTLNTKMKYHLGLVLSGGGARGFAHLGVLKAFEEHKIKPDAISGTSAGALIGAFYAAGYTADEILSIAKEVNFFSFKKL